MSAGNRRSERQEQILVAAEKVFDAEGYAAATMEAVAVEAGVAKGSIYNYFASKQDLFAQVCLDALAADRTDLERLVDEAGPAAEKIEWLVDTWYQRLGHYSRFGRLILEFWATAAREKRRGELTANLEGLTTVGEEEMRSIIEKGVASGEFDGDVDPAVAGALVLAVLRGVTVQTILAGSDVDGAFVAGLKRGLLASLGAG